MVSAERLRLDEADTGGVLWRRWGPYLSERQWGTVCDDYGSNPSEDVKECYFYLDAAPRDRGGDRQMVVVNFWQFHLLAVR